MSLRDYRGISLLSTCIARLTCETSRCLQIDEDVRGRGNKSIVLNNYSQGTFPPFITSISDHAVMIKDGEGGLAGNGK